MTTDRHAEEHTLLHTRPSAIEAIAADFPGWEISRERDGARHGAWQAFRDGVTLTAPSPAGLLVRLEAQELARLQAEHGARWQVWRTPRYWMATALVDDVEPTLMENTADALEARMSSPCGWGNQARKDGER